MKNDPLVKKLRAYLAATDGGPTKIAAALNYKSSDTARAWVRVGKVPHWCREALTTFLEAQNGNTGNRK